MSNRTKPKITRNALWQRETRAERDRLGLCRTCGDPAAVSAKTGKIARQCQRHLDMDIARKEIYILPERSEEAARRGKFELEYPLSWSLPT